MKNYSYEQINDACFQIAQKIAQQSTANPIIVAVSRGGLIPATIISHYLKTKDIRFIRLSSYSDNKEQSTLIDTTADEIPDNANTFIIDDICDSGETVQYLRNKYPQTKIYVLINKNTKILPDYFPISEPMGTWIHFPWEVEDD